MDTSTMSFGETIYNARYFIIGGALFLLFMGVFVREAVRELMTMRERNRGQVRSIAFGPIMNDPMLGHTMTDGGEPTDEANDEKTS